MAESIQTDSDSDGQSQTGIGRVDRTPKALHQIQPNWVEDGHGIVGPRRQVVAPASARPHRMDFGYDNTSNPDATGGAKLTVTTEDASGYSGGGDGTVDNVTTLTFDSALFEVYDGGGGQAVIKLKTTTCDA